MIKNQRQFRISKSHVDKFTEHLALIEKEIEKGNNSLLIAAEADAIRSQIAELEDQVYEYESLWSSGTRIPILQSFEDLPQALIRARISIGISQKELAEKIGIKEQQIQRYESTNYEAASLARVQELVTVLNLQLSDRIQLNVNDLTLRQFIKKLRQAGLERDFIIHRLLPPRISTIINAGRQNMTLRSLGLHVIEHIGKIFNWTSSEMLGSESLRMNVSSLGNVQYKVPRRVNKQRLDTYTLYSHYLASIIMNGTQHLPIIQLPNDPIKINNDIISTFGSFTLENALKYIWSFGVSVISIGDPGAFHGVFFREKGRNVIILKHRTNSHATWLFSLFHELWHAIEHQKDKEDKILEIEDFENLSDTENGSDGEQIANLFAGAVLLGRPTDELIHMCLEEAEYNLRTLKQTVQKIALKENVPVDVLANCVAFRVSQEGENWWGTANNLQETRNDIQRITTNILLDNVDLSEITGLDLDLLRRSLLVYEGK